MSPILLMTPDTHATFTSTVVIAGITIVIGVLLLLIFVFDLFGKIVPKIEKRTVAREQAKAEKKAAKKNKANASKAEKAVSAPKNTAMPVMPKSAPAPIVEPGISGEVVAAIAAAIAMTEGAGAVVRSIKKKNVGSRNPWAQAAKIENTRPF